MHEAKQVFIKSDESDGAIDVLMRCCGEASTDQWHRLYVKPETSDQEVQDFLAHAKARCEQQHSAIINARRILRE